LTKSPAGAFQWTPKAASAHGTVPDAHDSSKRHAPMMFTTDLSLRMDPIYARIAKRFHENPDQLAEAFAKAWYKLTHRDMGPVSRPPGPLGPPAAVVARSCPRRRSRTARGAGHRSPQGQDPRLGTVHFATGDNRLGFGVHVPGHRQTRRCERGAHPSGAAKGL